MCGVPHTLHALSAGSDSTLLNPLGSAYWFGLAQWKGGYGRGLQLCLFQLGATHHRVLSSHHQLWGELTPAGCTLPEHVRHMLPCLVEVAGHSLEFAARLGAMLNLTVHPSQLK